MRIHISTAPARPKLKEGDRKFIRGIEHVRARARVKLGPLRGALVSNAGHPVYEWIPVSKAADWLLELKGRLVGKRPKVAGMTEWFPHDVNPVHVGEYEVRNSRPMHWNAKGRLVGRNRRYWDGKRWLTFEPDHPCSHLSIMGTHETQQWRGLSAPADGCAGGGASRA